MIADFCNSVMISFCFCSSSDVFTLITFWLTFVPFNVMWCNYSLLQNFWMLIFKAIILKLAVTLYVTQG